MSQALQSAKCSYLRLFHAKVRGCNTFVGAARSLEKTHADVIQQIENKCPVNGKVDISSNNRTTILLQHGKQKVSAVSKRYVAENPCKSLDTKLAPVSVAEYKDRNLSAVWNCAHNQYHKPYIEHEDDTLQEDRNITGINRETLRGLSGQELNRLFQIAVTTARKRAESPVQLPSRNWTVQLANLLSVKLNSINAIMKTFHKAYLILDKRNVNNFDKYRIFYSTDPYCHIQHKTMKHVYPDKKQGIMYYADANDPSSNEMGNSPDSNKPSLDQLTEMRDYCVEVIPEILGKQHGLHYYRQDIILQNNYPDKPYQTNGLQDFVFQLAKLRWKANVKYMQIVVKVFGATINEQEGSFCIHWRFYGLPFKWLDVLKVWKWTTGFRKTVSNEKEVLEGLATFSIDKDGKIYKLRIDKVIVDPYGAEEKTPSLVEKLAMGGNPA